MTIKFRIHQTQRDGGQQNRRFHKIMYTAALRLGIIPNIFNGYIEIEFEGSVTDEVRAHEANEARKGTLYINDQSFNDVILILHTNTSGRPSLVTFWPISQHEDAKNSYTDPLVDTAMDGTPYDIELVATVMHEKFRENAGVSPATLMKILYEQEGQKLRDGALRIGQLLEESIRREEEALALVQSLAQKEEHAYAIAEEAIINIENLEKQKLVQEEEHKVLAEKFKDLSDEFEQMKKAQADIENRSEPEFTSSYEFEPARQVTRPWKSKTENPQWDNVGIEASIIDVKRTEINIFLTYVDKSGNQRTVHDFGYKGFVDVVYKYLISCKEAKRRAIFILTYKSDLKMRLAADTMMYGNYPSLWRTQ